jgi:hypothetical protein
MAAAAGVRARALTVADKIYPKVSSRQTQEALRRLGERLT